MRRPRRCEFQTLEPRLFLAATPAQVLTPQMRQALLDSLTLADSLTNSLNYKLRTNNVAAFDQQLLDYMRARDTGKFYFDVDADTVAGYAAYINANLNPATDVIARANHILNNRYTEQDSGSAYTVVVPDDVDWDHTGYSTNPETIHTLNRHTHWQHLAMAHRLTGDAAYADKVVAQLGDWSAESPAGTSGPQWARLNAAVRAERWSWTYALMLSSPRWTSAANTLMLVKMLEHGRYLYETTPAALSTNHAVSHAQGARIRRA